jgi:light-regulated signal transduction histidine kinase (bacteriophytochrome)
MFKRLHGRDEFGGGVGAGLTVVKKVVQRHGGCIWLNSAVGAGSTFYFTLPCGDEVRP